MAAAASASSLDEAKAKNVLRQVEFYFSDSNLPRDNFLRKAVEESDDGLVSLALVCSFPRMKSHLGLDAAVKPDTVPEETVLAVADVLRPSSVLRVTEDGKKVGRASELLKPDEIIQQVDSRTIAASPFPYNVKLEDVQSFFAQFAKVNSVRLPRHIGDKRYFCGTALVEFSEEEDVKNVVKNNLVFAGAELEIKPKKDFDVEREARTEEYERSHPNKNSSDEGYTKGLILAFKLKRNSADSATDQNGADKVDHDVEVAKNEETSESAEKSGKEPEEGIPENSDNAGKKSSDDAQQVDEVNAEETVQPSEEAVQPSEVVTEDNLKESEKKVEPSEEAVQPSDVVTEDNLGESEKKVEPSEEAVQPSDMVTEDNLKESENKVDNESLRSDDKSFSSNGKNLVLREDLKQVFGKFGSVKFVDYRMGEDSGYIRFEDPKASEKARAFAVLADEGGLVVKNHVATLEAVTGEAEKEYWNKIRGYQGSYKENRSYKGRAAKGSRGGRHFSGKRGRHSDSPQGLPNKAQKN